MIRIGDWATNRPVVKVQRCDACCEGNQINPMKEQRAIDKYLKRQQPHQFTVIEGGK